MSEQFYTILTKVGKAKIANATALGTKVNFCKFQLGDSNGAYYNPTEEQTELRHKVWQGNINNIRIDDKNPNWVIIEVILPSEIGGFTIREAAILDDEDNVIAVAKYPETYKPQTKDGSSKDILIRTILEVSNANSVTLKVDPTVILATKKDIEVLEQKIKNIKVPVTSVNTKIGDIMLKAEDIDCEDGKSVETHLDDMTKKQEEVFQSVSSGKSKVANAITGKGISTLVTDSFNTMANNINKIKTGYTSGDKIPMDKFEYIYKEGNNFIYKIEPLSKFDELYYSNHTWSTFYIDQNRNMYIDDYHDGKSKYTTTFYNNFTGKKKVVFDDYSDYRHHFIPDINDDTIWYEAYREKYSSNPSVTLITYKNTDRISSTTFEVPYYFMPNNDNSFSACSGVYNDDYYIYISTVYKYNSFGWKYRDVCVSKSNKSLVDNYKSDTRTKFIIGGDIYVTDNWNDTYDLYKREKEGDTFVDTLKYKNINSIVAYGTKYQLGVYSIVISDSNNIYIYDVSKNTVSKVMDGAISMYQRIDNYRFLVVRNNKLEDYVVNNDNTSVTLISQINIDYKGKVKLISKDGNSIITYSSPNLYFYDKEKVISGIRIK